LPHNHAVVIDEHIEHGPAELPGCSVQMRQLILQLDSSGVEHTSRARCGLGRSGHGPVKIGCSPRQKPTLLCGVASHRQQ
jgi:hypothetical protein